MILAMSGFDFMDCGGDQNVTKRGDTDGLHISYSERAIIVIYLCFFFHCATLWTTISTI